MCRCGIPAQVKQSKNEATAGRAFYTCATKWLLNEDGYPNEYNIGSCFFHQWIDGQDKFRIDLLLWQQLVVQPYHELDGGCHHHQIHMP
jgi:hypothetical protein